MKIATEVFNKKYKAQLEKDIVESIILRFNNKTQKIPRIIQEMLNLYNTTGDENIRILYNKN